MLKAFGLPSTENRDLELGVKVLASSAQWQLGRPQARWRSQNEPARIPGENQDSE